jgi:drug/metabolite transporter (DMT)-like permease
MTLSDFALYAVLVGIWGGSFVAIEFQLGVVANEVSILWRYLMAAIAMTGVCLIAKRRMRGFSPADHLHFVALGAFFFSFNYILIYRAQIELTSGLAAITFTMALFFTTLNARIFRRACGSVRRFSVAGRCRCWNVRWVGLHVGVGIRRFARDHCHR